MLTIITLIIFSLCVILFGYRAYDLTCENARLRSDRDTFIKQSWQLGMARYHVSKLLRIMQDSDYGDMKPHIERLEDLKNVLNAGEYIRLGSDDWKKWVKGFREACVSKSEASDTDGGLLGTTSEAMEEPTLKGTEG